MTKRLAVLATVVAIWVASLAAQASPILILISFDGWRWDYTDRANVPNLKALAARGVRSEGLIPSFPTVTFPNHYTIVTGLVPDHHGIVANGMFDATIGPQKFTMSAATAKDPRWWGGEPIWTTAMKQGLKSAATFWPGSEAIKPTYWRPFDDRVSNEDRVKLALELLKLPEGERPSFNTLYFSEVDHVGHDAGPDSPEVLVAAQHLDQALGQLLAGVDALGLTARTTFVVVSDHGMAQTSAERLIYLDDYVDLADIDVVEWSPNVAIRLKQPGSPAAVEALYRRLFKKHPALSVYKKETCRRGCSTEPTLACRPSSGSPRTGGRSRRMRRQSCDASEGSAARMATIRAIAICTGCSSPRDRAYAAATSRRSFRTSTSTSSCAPFSV